MDKCPKLSEIIEISQKYTAILKIVAADVSENFSYISRTVGSIDKNFQSELPDPRLTPAAQAKIFVS